MRHAARLAGCVVSMSFAPSFRTQQVCPFSSHRPSVKRPVFTVTARIAYVTKARARKLRGGWYIRTGRAPKAPTFRALLIGEVSP